MVIGKILGERGSLFNELSFYMWISIALLFFKDFRDEFFPERIRLFEARHFIVRLLSYVFIAILIVAIGVLDGGQFIYFQF